MGFARHIHLFIFVGWLLLDICALFILTPTYFAKLGSFWIALVVLVVWIGARFFTFFDLQGREIIVQALDRQGLPDMGDTKVQSAVEKVRAYAQERNPQMKGPESPDWDVELTRQLIAARIEKSWVDQMQILKRRLSQPEALIVVLSTLQWGYGEDLSRVLIGANS